MSLAMAMAPAPEVGARQLSAAPPAEKLMRLQILRGLAAVMVVVYHAIANHALPDSPLRFGALYEVLAGGVDVFFVISGFVIRHVTFARHGPAIVGTFLLKRLLRVAPLYWLVSAGLVTLALLLPGALRSYVVSPGNVLASFAFLPWPRADGTVFPPLMVGWTLNFEMMFYLAYAGLMAFVPRGAMPFALAGLFGGTIALAAAWGLDTRLFIAGDWHVIEFVVGVVLADLWRARRDWFDGRLAMFALALGLAGLGGALAQGPDLSLFSVFGFCALSVAALAVPGASRFDRLGRWLAALGDASYALYLVHVIVFSAVATASNALFGLAHLPAAGVAGMVALGVAAGFACHHLVEKPLLRRARRWSGP